MKKRIAPDMVRFETMTAEQIRRSFVVDSLFQPGATTMVYSDVDRTLIGSAVPTKAPLSLLPDPELRADTFCQRRELGVLNIGAQGRVKVDGKEYPMDNCDALYVARGSQQIHFTSANPEDPAQFYLLSFPAHADYKTTLVKIEEADTVHLGSQKEANERTIRKLIHPVKVQTCQLVMGVTELSEGCVWNTMPPHTHPRRMEVYLYFRMQPLDRVFHLMGRPNQTRHLVVKNQEAVISPSWSLHSGVGTAAYTFCWGMGGENQDFDDMDPIKIEDLQ